MNEMVKYHNHMNMVNFNGFNAVELDLLLSICAKIRDEDTKTIIYDFDDLRELSKYTATAIKSFIKDLKSTYQKLIRLTFCVGTETEFTEFVLFTKYKVSAINQEVTISVNQEFSYILNELTANFTRFELDEFISLQSKYAKNLYRLLKQFRSTGRVYFTIDDFKNKLDIPKSYKIAHIDQKILKPIKNELSPLFQNFSIEKVKSRKRGTPVTHINFSFTPQKSLQSEEKRALKQIQEIYFPDFTLDEVKTLARYGTHEHLKRASKQYDSHKECKPITNKMGFMVNTVKQIAESGKKTVTNSNSNIDLDKLSKNLFESF